jgi:hypothetical protein
MVDNVSTKVVRGFTGSVVVAAALIGTAHAGDQSTSAEHSGDCAQFTGDERADCERRVSMKESPSADQQSATAAAADQRDESRSSRTRVSEADTTKQEDSGLFGRESEPGQVQGADMHSAPLPNYENANEDLTDPYQTAPEGLEPGEEAPDR